MPEICEVSIHVDNLNSYCPSKWKLTNLEFLSGRYTRHSKPQGYTNLKELFPLQWLGIKNKGKFIYLQFENDINICVTLAMTGRFLLKPQKHSHIKFTFENETELFEFYFDDTRNFGRITILNNQELNLKLKTIGTPYITEDPNNRKFGVSEQKFKQQLEKHKHKNICVFLMDQKIFAGIGNYLLSEILFESRIFPYSLISEISTQKLNNLLANIKSIISFSYKNGGCSLRDFTNFYNEQGKFQNYLKVFNQSVDPYRNSVIKETGPHKRTIHYSPAVQQKEKCTSSLEPLMKKMKIK